MKIFVLQLMMPAAVVSLSFNMPRHRSPTVAVQMGIGKALLGRFRRKRTVEAAPQILVGDALPTVDVELVPPVQPSVENSDSQSGDALPTVDVEIEPPVEPNVKNEDSQGAVTAESKIVPSVCMSLATALGNGTSILIGMPGAFTPTCSDKHLPGYIKQADAFKVAGVSKIAVVTTNDRFVNDAWNKAVAACAGVKDGSTIEMLSDGDGDVVKALGLVDDMGFGLGVRSKRFALLCKNGIVKHVAVDEGMENLNATSAESMLSLVMPPPQKVNSAGEMTDTEKFVTLAIGAVLATAVLLYASSNGGEIVDQNSHPVRPGQQLVTSK